MSAGILEQLATIEANRSIELLRGVRYEIELLRKMADDLIRLANVKEARANRVIEGRS